jgi:hypothetical protein
MVIMVIHVEPQVKIYQELSGILSGIKEIKNE